MTILAIDTATEMLGIALETEDGRYYEWSAVAGFEHAQRLMPWIDRILDHAATKPEAIDLIVCARGPGSFTGLRIGMSTAKGLADATGAAVVSVPTLDALAYSHARSDRLVVPVLDARKQRIYCAAYEDASRRTDYLDTPVSKIEAALPSGRRRLITGVSPALIHSVCERVTDAEPDPCPQRGKGTAYIVLGRAAYEDGAIDAVDAGPMYIRKSDAEIANERER